MKYDVVVIGSGPGGYVAALRAAELGLKTACIEKDKTVGGTCLNVGCIPSKALLQSTDYYSLMSKEGKELGLLFDGLNFNFEQMMQRKQTIVDGLVKGIEGAFKQEKVAHIQGMASFIDANTISVVKSQETKEIQADYFILATGSESVPLPFLQFDETRILSSTGALALKSIPKKMIVIGAGIIGVELASVYNRLGTEVVIVEMLNQICPGLDSSIAKSFLQILKKQGITFHLGAKVQSGQVNMSQVSLTVLLNDELQNINADVVLVAVGRRPFTRELALEKIGVSLSEKKQVLVNASFQTNVPNIYAIGDLIDGPMLAHRASQEGRAVAEILAKRNPIVNYLALPSVIYTNPEVASVGLTEEEAKEMQLEIKTGTSFFKASGRARCMGQQATQGFVKVIADAKSGRLIGVHILGPQASELIAEGVMAIQKKASLQEIANTFHAHPTLSETFQEAVLNALSTLSK